MLEQFRKYIASNHLINKGDRILVALSGGVDSMVLAELLRREGYNIAFAHCNFHLRGAESDGDEQFVREYADRVGMKLFVKQFDTLQFVENNKVSVEMAARELRYAWFNELIDQQFDKLALAHHADDQIETFFINLLRGSGIKGLKAMQPCNGKYIRPLLWASREEITKGSLRHLEKQLKKTPGQHADDIIRVIGHAGVRGLSVNLYLEDWSNGMADSPEYVFALLDRLRFEPVQRVMLPDTLGVLNPWMVEEYIGRPIRTEAQCREDFRLKRHVEYFETKDPHAAP